MTSKQAKSRHCFIWIAALEMLTILLMLVSQTSKQAVTDRLLKITHATLFPKQLAHKIANETSPKVCIAMGDTRYTLHDLDIANFTIQDIQAYTRSNNLSYWQTSALINKAYALEYGYKLILTNGSEYQEFLKQRNRKAVWFKPNFVLYIQNSRPECEWVAFMDSDAVFYMSGHTISINEFLSNVGLHESSPGYIEHQLERIKRHGSFPFGEWDADFIIG
jgi:hypothetical protein